MAVVAMCGILIVLHCWFQTRKAKESSKFDLWSNECEGFRDGAMDDQLVRSKDSFLTISDTERPRMTHNSLFVAANYPALENAIDTKTNFTECTDVVVHIDPVVEFDLTYTCEESVKGFNTMGDDGDLSRVE